VRRVYKKIKDRVERYVREHPGVTEDKIAEDLELHIIDVLSALVILEEEGKVKSMD